MIGLYEVATDELITTIDTTQHTAGDFPNSLKGLAWSPDGSQIAAVYHHGNGGHISLIDAATRAETRTVPISHFSHTIAYTLDGNNVQLDNDSISVKP